MSGFPIAFWCKYTNKHGAECVMRTGEDGVIYMKTGI